MRVTLSFNVLLGLYMNILYTILVCRSTIEGIIIANNKLKIETRVEADNEIMAII